MAIRSQNGTRRKALTIDLMSSIAGLVSNLSLQSGADAGVWQHAALKQSVNVGSCAKLLVVGHGCDKTNMEDKIICLFEVFKSVKRVLQWRVRQ